MKNDELRGLLIEYVEGTLDPLHRTVVEDYLRSSKTAREEYEMLRSAFASLRNIQEPHVPQFYFNNFLPHLRERIESEKKKSFLSRMLSAFDTIKIFPNSASIYSYIGTFFVLISIVAAFELFHPNPQTSHLISLVADAKEEDVAQFSEEVGSIAGKNESVQVENLAEIIHIQNLEHRMHQILFASDDLLTTLQSTSSYADIEPVVAALNDEEMNLVMEKLDIPIYN